MDRVGNSIKNSVAAPAVIAAAVEAAANTPARAIDRRVRVCDYLVVAQLFLQNNFLLKNPLEPDDIKPRLLGHWGTCHGIDVVYANLKQFFGDFHFVLGPGHGFPALQANLYLDGELQKVDGKATLDEAGLGYLCKSFSWPGGYPSHASPVTPGVICEGGELGYALATAYGAALACPDQIYCVLIGDGELETATALASLNLHQLLAGENSGHGRVLPILHLNGYKISAPTLAARRSERELHQLLRGFGYQPVEVKDGDPEEFQKVLQNSNRHTFIIFRSEKGAGSPAELHGEKIAGNFLSHQIPLPHAKTDSAELQILENWLKSYHFNELGVIQ